MRKLYSHSSSKMCITYCDSWGISQPDLIVGTTPATEAVTNSLGLLFLLPSFSNAFRISYRVTRYKMILLELVYPLKYMLKCFYIFYLILECEHLNKVIGVDDVNKLYKCLIFTYNRDFTQSHTESQQSFKTKIKVLNIYQCIPCIIMLWNYTCFYTLDPAFSCEDNWFKLFNRRPIS